MTVYVHYYRVPCNGWEGKMPGERKRKGRRLQRKKKRNPRVAELQSAWIIGFKRLNAQKAAIVELQEK